MRRHGGIQEVLVHLVVAAVFKTVGTCVNRWSGGFDSHALPPFFRAFFRTVSCSLVYHQRMMRVGNARRRVCATAAPDSTPF